MKLVEYSWNLEIGIESRRSQLIFLFLLPFIGSQVMEILSLFLQPSLDGMSVYIEDREGNQALIKP